MIAGRGRRVAIVALVLGAMAALVLVPGLPALCPMRWALRLPCPGCGMTRAAALALTGHFGEATRMHPLWFLVLPLVALVIASDAIGYVREGRWRSALGSDRAGPVAVGVVALMLAVWVARFFGMFGGPAPV